MPKIVLNPEVKLTDDEQEYLFALIHNGQHSARLITCARILSKRDRSHSHQEVCSALEVSWPTVLKIRKRFAGSGLEAALSELPRPGSKPKLDAKQAAMITAIACSKAPDGHDHWTLRMLGSKIVEFGYAPSYNHEGVRKLLKKMILSPGKSSSGASQRWMKSSWPTWKM